MIGRGFVATAAALAGGLVVALGAPLFRLWSMLWTQVAAPRALGVLAVLAVCLLAVAALLAPATRALPVAWRRPAGTAFYLVALLNLAAIGLFVFFVSPGLAPKPALVAALAVPLALAAAFHRQADEARALALGGFVRLGQVVLAVPLLALPYVAWGAAHDQPRLPGAPRPVAGTAVRPDAPKRIVVVSFDGLRLASTTLADPRGGVTPTLAALAREGTAYMGLRAVSDRTSVVLPAMEAGIWPGQLYRTSISEGARVRGGFMTGLAGHLAPAGYRAGAFMMALDPRTTGFEREYATIFSTLPAFAPNVFNTEEYLPLRPTFGWLLARATGRRDVEDHRLVHNPFAAREVFKRALAFLQAEPGRAYARVHVAIPHTPMGDMPPGRLEDLWPPGVRWIGDPDFEAATPDQMIEFRRIYHAYARFGDTELGIFLDGLRQAGLYDDAMIVVTSDHGEDLVTKDYPTHAHGVLTDRVVRVPLVVRRPSPYGRGRRAAAERAPGLRDDRLASHVDLLPTLLNGVYDRLPEGLPGRALDGPVDPDRIAFTWAMEARFFGHREQHASIAAYQGRYRYLLHLPPFSRTPEETLTDTLADPEGRRDLKGREPAVFARLRAATRRDNALGPDVP